MDNVRLTTDGSCATCPRPSSSYASALWGYMAFRKLISASQGARVTVRTISLLIQRYCLKQLMFSSYPFTLESHQAFFYFTVVVCVGRQLVTNCPRCGCCFCLATHSDALPIRCRGIEIVSSISGP